MHAAAAIQYFRYFGFFMIRTMCGGVREQSIFEKFIFFLLCVLIKKMDRLKCFQHLAGFAVDELAALATFY